jgi:signal transduction histidine kinase
MSGKQSSGSFPLNVVHIVLCIVTVFLIGHTGLLAAEPQPGDAGEKQVVVLYSMPRDFPATEMVEQGLVEELAKENRLSVQLYSEYLDLSRFRDVPQRTALANLLQNRYGGGNIDLVICVDVPAALFLMENGDKLFSGIPVVMCSIPEALKDRILASPLKQRVSGVLEPAVVSQRLVESALRFKPDTKHVVLISGAFENDHARSVALRDALEAMQHKVKFIDLTGLSLGDILERCEHLPQDSIIFYSTLFVDGKGRSYVPRMVLRSIAANTDLPIFGPYESYMGDGIIGGPLVSLRLEGKKAAEMALRILRGQSPGDSPFTTPDDIYLTQYDWRQLQRHNIAKRFLPKNSTILFREATIWDLYKQYIVGVVILLALQTMLIVGLVFNLRQRKKAEAALRDSRSELQTLAGRLISSQEEELSRLSREFHDDYAQRLAALAIETGTLELHSAQLEPAPLRDRIGHIKEQVINLSDDIHALSRELHPAILKDLGLERAVNSLCINFSDREDIPVNCHYQALPEDMPPDAALCVYRVIQEGLRNIAKHAHARHVDVFLQGSANRLLATIEDDGAGFEPKCARHTPGIGLASMRERVQYVKGEFTVSSEPGHGTVITLSVPLNRD